MNWNWLKPSYWITTQHNQTVPENAIFYTSVDFEVSASHYRKPAIYAFGSYLFAFCEQRLDTIKDYGIMHIGMRRIKASKIKKGSPEGHKWDVYQQLPVLDGFRTMNPCPVGCSDTNNLYLLVSAISVHVLESEILKGTSNEDFKIYVSCSSDFGDTWSDWKDITYNFSENLPVGAKFVVTGPGHGFEMQSGCLVVPGFFYRNPDLFKLNKSVHLSSNHLKYPFRNVGCSFCLLSTDKGRSWFISSSTDNFAFCVSGGLFRNMGECSIVECKRDCLLLNSGECGNGQYRILAKSLDGGLNWSRGSLCTELSESSSRGCKGGLAKVVHENVTFVVAINCGHPSARKNLTLWLSSDCGKTWSKPWTVIDDQFCGYSDIDTVICPGSKEQYVLLIFETGEKSEHERIDFLCVDFAEILQMCQLE